MKRKASEFIASLGNDVSDFKVRYAKTQRIKALIEKLPMSTRKFCIQFSHDPGYISMIMNDKKIPFMDKLKLLEKQLKSVIPVKKKLKRKSKQSVVRKSVNKKRI